MDVIDSFLVRPPRPVCEYHLDNVTESLFRAVRNSASAVEACISDIDTAAAVETYRLHVQQMLDSFSELAAHDAKLRLALLHSVARCVGATGIVNVESDGPRLVATIESDQEAYAQELDRRTEKFLTGKSKPDPLPLRQHFDWLLEALGELQHSVDNGDFCIMNCHSIEDFNCAMDSLDAVMQFARVRR